MNEDEILDDTTIAANAALAEAAEKEMRTRHYPRLFAGAKRGQREARANWLVKESYQAALEKSGRSTPAEGAKRSPKLRVWTGGRKFRVTIPDNGDISLRAKYRAAMGLGKRGAIRGFSSASRRRALSKLAELRRDSAQPLFLTLTVAREWGFSAREIKEKLRVLFKRFARQFDCSLMWKLEPHADGTPHLHGLMWGTPFFKWQELARMWAEVVSGEAVTIPRVVGADDWFHAGVELMPDGPIKKQLLAGTRIEAIQSWRGVMSYCAKYIGKPIDGELDESAGRYWGVMGRKNMPLAAEEVEVVTYETAARVVGWLRRKLRERNGWQPWIEQVMGMFTDRPEVVWKVAL